MHVQTHSTYNLHVRSDTQYSQSPRTFRHTVLTNSMHVQTHSTHELHARSDTRYSQSPRTFRHTVLTSSTHVQTHCTHKLHARSDTQYLQAPRTFRHTVLTFSTHSTHNLHTQYAQSPHTVFTVSTHITISTQSTYNFSHNVNAPFPRPVCWLPVPSGSSKGLLDTGLRRSFAGVFERVPECCAPQSAYSIVSDRGGAERQLSAILRHRQGLKTASNISSFTLSAAGGSLLFHHLERLKIKYL